MAGLRAAGAWCARRCAQSPLPSSVMVPFLFMVFRLAPVGVPLLLHRSTSQPHCFFPVLHRSYPPCSCTALATRATTSYHMIPYSEYPSSVIALPSRIAIKYEVHVPVS